MLYSCQSCLLLGSPYSRGGAWQGPKTYGAMHSLLGDPTLANSGTPEQQYNFLLFKHCSPFHRSQQKVILQYWC